MGSVGRTLHGGGRRRMTRLTDAIYLAPDSLRERYEGAVARLERSEQ